MDNNSDNDNLGISTIKPEKWESLVKSEIKTYIAEQQAREKLLLSQLRAEETAKKRAEAERIKQEKATAKLKPKFTPGKITTRYGIILPVQLPPQSKFNVRI